jgi:hypothetical protein
MPKHFKTARFHFLTGPSSLFERVQYKFWQQRELKINAAHFIERSYERDIPIEKIIHFNPDSWKLILVEVFTSRGKFVSTTWEVNVDSKKWWVVIGLNDTIVTVYKPNSGKIGNGECIVKDGGLYEFVEKVNRDLMDNEQ